MVKNSAGFPYEWGRGQFKIKIREGWPGLQSQTQLIDREEEDVPDIAHLLPFNGKMVFQNSSMTPLLLILTFNS
jgi:hypothetical protein